MRHDISLFDAPFFNISPHEAKVRVSVQESLSLVKLLIECKVNGPSTETCA